VARQQQTSVPIVGMAGRDHSDAIRAFVERHDLGSIPHTIDDDGTLWRRFRVLGQPAWVFVRPDGTTRIALGALSAEQLHAELDLVERGATSSR
jgi:hypothetical protein